MNFHKNGPVGCLLIHGFTGSPNELQELGEFLASKDVTVSIPTLPGHATHSGDMFNYTWQDWFVCVKDSHRHLQDNCEEVFACGLSMGGTLALHLAAHRQVRGVITLAGAIAFPAWKKMAVRVLQRLVRFRKKRGGEDVQDLTAKPALGSYRRFPLYAVGQLFRLTDHVRDDLSEIEQPILVVHSKQDHTISFSNSDIIVSSVASSSKRKVDLEHSYHVITVDVEKERVKEEVLAFIQTHSEILETEASQPHPQKPKIKAA